MSRHSAKEKIPSDDGIFSLERVGGVEPPFRPWQGRIIAAIRYPPVFTEYNFCRAHFARHMRTRSSSPALANAA